MNRKIRFLLPSLNKVTCQEANTSLHLMCAKYIDFNVLSIHDEMVGAKTYMWFSFTAPRNTLWTFFCLCRYPSRKLVCVHAVDGSKVYVFLCKKASKPQAMFIHRCNPIECFLHRSASSEKFTFSQFFVSKHIKARIGVWFNPH